MFDASTSRCEASWNHIPFWILTWSQISVVTNRWWKLPVFTWRQKRAECWWVVWTPSCCTRISIYLESPGANVVLPFRALHQYYSIFTMAQQVPCKVQSERWRKRVENMDVNDVLGQLLGDKGAAWMKSIFQHLTSSMGYFARLKLEKRTLDGYYTGMLLYQNLHGRQHDKKIFRGKSAVADHKGLSNLFCAYITGRKILWWESP